MSSPASFASRCASVVTVTLALMALEAHRVSAQQAETVSDADSARVIAVVVGALIAFGIALAIVTAWFWRTTRPDDPTLLRLEMMGRRRVRRLPPDDRRSALDACAARSSDEPAVGASLDGPMSPEPADAPPLDPGLVQGVASGEQTVR